MGRVAIRADGRCGIGVAHDLPAVHRVEVFVALLDVALAAGVGNAEAPLGADGAVFRINVVRVVAVVAGRVGARLVLAARAGHEWISCSGRSAPPPPRASRTPGLVLLFRGLPQVLVALHATDLERADFVVRNRRDVLVAFDALPLAVHALFELVPDHVQRARPPVGAGHREPFVAVAAQADRFVYTCRGGGLGLRSSCEKQEARDQPGENFSKRTVTVLAWSSETPGVASTQSRTGRHAPSCACFPPPAKMLTIAVNVAVDLHQSGGSGRRQSILHAGCQDFIRHKKAGRSQLFLNGRLRYFVDSTVPTAALSSASDAVAFGWPLPSFSFATSAASAPLSSLCLAAISLNDGPTFFLSVSWQFEASLALQDIRARLGETDTRRQRSRRGNNHQHCSHRALLFSDQNPVKYSAFPLHAVDTPFQHWDFCSSRPARALSILEK